MFKFIKKLFNTDNEIEVKSTVVNIPEVNDRELLAVMREANEAAAAFEQRRADRHQVLTDAVKRLGIVHKFRDTTTGEIHEVEADDFDTFDKMMCNRNMRMIFD